MNRQPYGMPPKWWEPKLNPLLIRLSAGYRFRKLQRIQQFTDVTADGIERVQQAVADGKGVLIVPNHSAHYDAAMLYAAADRVRMPMYLMTAWQVFAMGNRFDRWVMQWLGCFSVDRESSDKQAFKRAVQILKQQPHPLIIFPEGDVYHVTDRVSAFREGAAAIALSAAKRGDRPIEIFPCGIKFWYVDDPTNKLLQVMEKLEDRVLMRTQTNLPLVERIYRLAEGVMALKEIDYLGSSRSGALRERFDYLTESILSRLEKRHQVHSDSSITSARVKALRQEIIHKVHQQDNLPADRGSYFRNLEQDMDDLYFVIQLFSYPGDYLRHNPTIERISETIDKLEEDILGVDLPTVRGRRRVEVRFGEPIAVNVTGNRRDAVAQLTTDTQNAVQGLIDSMNA